MDEADFQKIQELADRSVEQCLADYEAEREARRLAAEPTAEQQQERTQFRDYITEHALLHGVNPKSVRFVLREAEAVFEWRDGGLVSKHYATDPADPCALLTVTRWLNALRKTDAYLFAAPGKSQ